MNIDLRTLKVAISLHDLVRETHDIDRNGKVLCPAHDDHTPSCHIYGSRYHYFSCKACGDAVDWLKLTQGLSTAEAIRELERRAGGTFLKYLPNRLRVLEPSRPLSRSRIIC